MLVSLKLQHSKQKVVCARAWKDGVSAVCHKRQSKNYCWATFGHV